MGAVGRAEPAEDPLGLGAADRVQDAGAVTGQMIAVDSGQHLS